MIEDSELRGLFEAECAERLQAMDDGLLALEKKPEDKDTFRRLFREAHSLKGTARMLGVSGVEKVAHRFEDLLSLVDNKEIRFTSRLVDGMIAAVDAIRKMVDEAVSGKPSGVVVDEVIQNLAAFTETREHEKPQTTEKTPPAPSTRHETPAAFHSKKKDIPLVEKPVPAKEKETSDEMDAIHPKAVKSAGRDDSYHISAIRVKPKRLDKLMNQVGELAVTRTRLRQRMADTADLNSLWDDFLRTFDPFSENEAVGRLVEEMDKRLQLLHHDLAEDNQSLEMVARELEEGVRNLRLLPLNTLFTLFPRMVRDLCRELSKKAEVVMSGADTTVDKFVLEEMKSPLTHLIRNAVHHGLETPEEREFLGKPSQGVIRLTAHRTSTHVVIEVGDDGAGMDLERIKKAALKGRFKHKEDLDSLSDDQIFELIFTPGLSTSPMITDVSGRGVGMDAVRDTVTRLKGTVSLASEKGKGSRFTIRIPISLSTSRVFVVTAQNQWYALPVDFVESIRQIKLQEVMMMEGYETIAVDDDALSLLYLTDLLEIEPSESRQDEKKERQNATCIVLTEGKHRMGLVVDDILEQTEVVVKPHGKILGSIRNISGATILGNGRVCMVLNPLDLIHSARSIGAGKFSIQAGKGETLPKDLVKKRLLLAEDSITTRTQEKRILLSAGYEVTTAVDGLDAWSKLSEAMFDGVVSDVEMPNMDGFDLTRKIRGNKSYQDVPVILVTSLSSDDDRTKGLECGADAFITKPSFDQTVLLDTLRKLV